MRHRAASAIGAFLIPGVLLVACSRFASEKRIALRFTPKENVTANIPAAEGVTASRAIEVLSLIDARGLSDRTLVGENREHNTAVPIRATSSVEEFATIVLKKCLAEWGVRLGTGDLALRGEITNLLVTEDQTYSTAVSIRFRLEDRSGSALWEGVVMGDAHQWGSSFKEENYNEEISDALKRTYANLISNAGFQKAWMGQRVSSEQPLSLADLKAKILEMIKAGIGTEVIVGYVKNVKMSGPLSAEQIVEWKKAGIPDAVLEAAVSRLTRGRRYRLSHLARVRTPARPRSLLRPGWLPSPSIRCACDRGEVLYYGDNLDVLRRYVKDETVDLVYLDPPFNSNQDYNVLFGERNGKRAAAQMKAFEDTWTWDEEAARAYQETVEAGGKPSDAMQAFRRLLPESDMLAYLSMMAPRLIELRRVLKRTGGLYLHCDPTASHYLKVLMDAVFGPEQFRNEIIWRRTSGHSDATRYGSVHDTILFFVRSSSATWNQTFQEYEPAYVEQYYRYSDPDGRRWMSGDLGAAGLQGGGYDYVWKGIHRIWRVPRETMERLDTEGRVFYTKNGIPRIKRYLDESKGLPVQDVWTDLEALRSWHQERLGYPTQKPQALLERIIRVSSNEGDTVLDPFCGCGTTVAAAQALKRNWIGIDITHVAIGLIKKRLSDAYGSEIAKTYRVIGEPVSVPDAERLAAEDPYQFQWWALGLVGARPTEGKKGTDKGVDGRLFFHDDKAGETKQVIFSVKAGGLKPEYVRELRGVVDREKAAIGVLISFQEPTKPMRAEAASAGFYSSAPPSAAASWGGHPRLQLRTVAELLDGKGIDYPPTKADSTFKKAPRATYDEPTNRELPLEMVAERPESPKRPRAKRPRS